MKNIFTPYWVIFLLTAFAAVAHAETFLETGFEVGIPAGWTQNQIAGTASWSTQTGGTANGGAGSNPASAHTGSANAILFSPSNTSRSSTRLITPTLDTTGFINITLTFWHAQEIWFSDQDELKVFYSSDGGSSWTELAHYTDNIAEWTRRDLEIPSSGSGIRIAFEGGAIWGHGVCLDNVSVQGIPDTFSELSVTATDVSAAEPGEDTGSWTITRSGNTTGPLTINYTLSGSADSGSDYTVDLPSPVSFAAGENSKVITLTVVDNAVAESVEIATLTLASGSGYAVSDLAASADISILDDDPFDLNILIIGSTHSFSEGGEPDVVHEKPFDATAIATHLKSILDQDPANSGTVNVEFEDIFKTKTNLVQTSGAGSVNITEHCYSLAQHYFWPDGKAERLANLRGEDGAEWDYIILTSDPYIMANFPGMHAEGVKLIKNEVAQGANPAQVVLLAQWPENSSTFTADDFNEIIHRIGGSAGLTFVPAGNVWDSYTSQDTDAVHPTPKGEYLAAASIYSKLYGRSAKSSNFSFPSDGDAIADHALSEVQAIAAVPQYSGAYTTVNAFQMKYVKKRDVRYRETGTSTENRIAQALARLDDVSRITFGTGSINNKWDFNYGRGNDGWEDEKDYEVDPAKFDRSYGFPMHYYNTGTAPLTMPYGIDKHYHGSRYEDGSDLGIAYNMVRPNTRETGLPEGHDVRAIPIRLMWLKMEAMSPGLNPLQDSTHMNNHLNDATAAFMYTLLSGRCPVVEEPDTPGSTAWLQWLGHKIGYETAWQMAHLTTRVPGFRVLPSSTSAISVTPTTSETMTVQFANPPQAEVTVTVSTSSTAAILSPKTLVFTPANYNIPQQVNVTGLPGASASESFDVIFSTSSDDEVFDGLSDSWGYTNNRSSTETVTQADNGSTQVITLQYTAVDISLNVAGAAAGNTSFAGPSNGSVSWSGTADIQYTPSGDYLGSDQIVYAVTLNGTQTIGTIDLSVVLPDGQVNATAGDPNASEEGPDTGTFLISRFGDITASVDVFFTLSGTATSGDDYTLSHTSPVTIPAGQESVTLTLTPVDDSVFGEHDETAVLTITEDAAYPIGVASASITIADNDNRAPTANAGEDQSAQLDPAMLVPGLYYGAVPGNIDLTTPNPETQVLVDPSVETENTIAGNTTEIYTGNIFDADGQISFTEHIDDRARIWIDDVLVLTNDTWGTRSDTGNLDLSPGWHSIEIRIANGSGGSGPVGGEIGIGYDPEGGTAWQVLTDPGDGSFLRVSQIAGVDVNLAGTASDPDSDPLVTTWTAQSGPGPVTFAIANALSTTATFTESGVYVLRLTVNDGTESVFDDVTITVSQGSDTSSPTLLTLDPGHSASGVNPSANLSITFNENVAFGTGNITLRESGGALFESFDVANPPAGLSLSDDTVTIDPTANLAGFTTYYVEIPASAIDDLAGNSFAGISDSSTWSFTTSESASVDINVNLTRSGAPNESGYTNWETDDNSNPSNLVVGAATLSVVDINAGTTLRSIDRGGDDGYAGTLTSLTRTWWGQRATSTGPGGYITIDVSGLAAGDYTFTSWHLDHEDQTGEMKIEFSDDDGASFTDVVAAFDLVAGNDGATGPIEKSFNFTSTGADIQIRFTNTASGGSGTATFGLANGFSITGGNADTTPPTLSATDPADQAADVSASANLVATFDEDIAFGSGLVTIRNLTDATDSTINITDGTQITISAATLTINPATDLAKGKDYAVRIASTAIEDSSGNAFAGISDDSTWNFSTVAPTFSDWIGGYTGLGGLTALDDDPDGDGLANGLENYFGTHPGEASQGLTSGAVETSGDTTFSFSHPLNASPAKNLTALYRWSKNLSSFHADGATFEGSTVTFVQGVPDGNNSVTVTATVTGTPVNQLFVVINVTEN